MASVMIRIMPSDPAFAELDRLAGWIAMLKNRHMFWDLRDMPEIECLANIIDLECQLEELCG